MSVGTLQSTYFVILIVGIVLTAVGTWGTNYYSKKASDAKDLDLQHKLSESDRSHRADLIKKDEEIADLNKKVNVIHTMELQVAIDLPTDPRPIGEKETSVGLSSSVALFTDEKIRYRFVTDFQYSTWQIQDNINRIMFRYEPEEPSQILGRPIEFLSDIKIFVCNYSSFLEKVGFTPGDKGSVVTIEIFLNGVRIADLKNTADPGVLAKGQAELDVSSIFSNITEQYSTKLSKMRSDSTDSDFFKGHGR